MFPTYKNATPSQACYNTCVIVVYLPFLPGPVIVPGIPSVPIRPAGKGTFSYVMSVFRSKSYFFVGRSHISFNLIIHQPLEITVLCFVMPLFRYFTLSNI